VAHSAAVNRKTEDLAVQRFRLAKTLREPAMRPGPPPAHPRTRIPLRRLQVRD
jgi:hypothetical protein